jgi:transcriptional regulator with XRE-family HTH domain
MTKKSIIRKSLASNVKYYRYLIGYTQEKLAEKCDLNPRHISDIEIANDNIAIDTLEKIAQILKIDSYLLIKNQEHKNLLKKVNMKS